MNGTLQDVIDRADCLTDIAHAIEDVRAVEWDAADRLRVAIGDESRRSSMSFVHRLPPEVLLVGLRAMQSELERMTQQQEVAA